MKCQHYTQVIGAPWLQAPYLHVVCLQQNDLRQQLKHNHGNDFRDAADIRHKLSGIMLRHTVSIRRFSLTGEGEAGVVTQVKERGSSCLT